MRQIYKKTPMKCELLCNFIEITLRHGCFPVNLLYTLSEEDKWTAGSLEGWVLMVF